MRGRWLILAPILAVATAMVGTVAHEPVSDHPVFREMSGPDVVNPMRGQFDNITTGLFPQANVSQQHYPDWPGTKDAAIRVNWRSLQPVDPRTLPPEAPESERYDFSEIDAALAAYGAQGMRVGLRVSAYDSCCETSPEGNVNIGAPDWLTTVPGATTSYEYDGIRQVIPSWNDNNYVGNFEALLAALGRRYDRDERLSIFEMSGYGDFSENHVAFMRDQLGLPGPEEESSEAELGYYSQYRDQYITKDTVVRLVDANLRAFANTQIVTATGNPEIVKQLLRDSAELAGTVKPVGLRADCLGVFSPVPTWADNRYSKYVERADPIIDVLRERYSTAPVLTEWCQKPDDMTSSEYYERGLADVIDNHVSMTASSGFPDQFNGDTMDRRLYSLWSQANVVAGYRYVADATAHTSDQAGTVSGTVRWTNKGSGSTHENWTIEYRLLDPNGAVVQTVPSVIDLRSMSSPQSTADNGTVPTPTTAQETIEFDTSGLSSGFYTVSAAVVWNEHKAGATTTVDYEPMNLAQNGRGRDGSYGLVTFQIP
ncbi:hypothetical protein SAMN05421642_113118 [Rhodococcoides kyotonense]|uniref:DUF4832 domain-containing protein n=2 Tax=Rhodococcoides kyotonense TaxID=398843 RepID=A0A239LMP9_9NOCA|nr:hypothetical protein SAMN05421642_113118 [Rhodococcus kyotonensis]